MKTARLEARLTDAQKELVARAASFQGVSQTDFVLMSVLDEARRVVRDQQTIDLSLEQSMRVADALMNPPKPNKALRKAYSEHREQTVS